MAVGRSISGAGPKQEGRGDTGSAGTSVTFSTLEQGDKIDRMVTQPGLRRDSEAGPRAGREKAIFRRWQRYRLNLPIRVIVTRDEGTRIADGRANDISEGGMLIFAGIELRAEDQVMVEFTPPYSSNPLRVPGIVRHRRGYNYGVEFRLESASDIEDTAKFRNLVSLSAGGTGR